MKVKTMIEWLSELPEDYDMCLSEYMFLECDEDDEEGESYIICLDKPIFGIVKEDEHKEIRVLIRGYDVAEENGEHVIEIEKIGD
jgi:hypothetical protein